jgi:VanZ family protein
MTGKSFIKSNRRGRILRYAPLILWIGLVFYLSSSQGSMTETSRFIRPFLEWIFPLASAETLNNYHAYIRKSAHFFLYAALAFWSWQAFRNSSVEFVKSFRYVFSLAVVLLIASIDETNQSFNAARTGTIYDVILDFSGGLTMILIIYFCANYLTRKQMPQL